MITSRFRSVLVIAPHADDEVLGCGATILKMISAGAKVSVCYVTSPSYPKWTEEYIENRKKEIAQLKKESGIKDCYFLKYDAAALTIQDQSKISEKISHIVKSVDPDTVLIPFSGDLHTDHSIISRASKVACRPFHSNVKNLWEYETLSETEWGEISFNPNIYVDIEEYISKKVSLLKIYGSEIFNFPHPRSSEAVISLSKKRGSEAYLKNAEAFSIVREIV